MRIKDINENPFKKFQQGVAKGFTATQKGGAVGPDAFAQGVKNFFTNVGKDDDKKKEKPVTPKGGGAGTGDTVKKAKEPKATKTDQPAPKAAAPTAGDDFPVGYAGGEKHKVKSGDVVDYTNAKGQERQATVTKLLDTRDKKGALQIGLSLKGALYALDREKITKVNGKDWKFTESEEKTMSKAMKEGLADLAGKAEMDHEVQMARADLYKIAKYAIKLHDMLKSVSEAEGLEGWQQAKITKAADYIGSVYHNLEYDMKFGEGMNEAVEMCPEACCGKPVTECSCGPDCKHCDCYDKNKAMKEGKYKSDAQRKAVHAAKSDKKDTYKESIAKKLSEKLASK